MSALFEDNFELYGSDTSKLLEGVYAELGQGVLGGNEELVIPSWEEDGRYWFKVQGRGSGIRKVLSQDQSSIGAFFIYRTESLPDSSRPQEPCVFLDSGGTQIFALRVTTTGQLQVESSAGNVIHTTTANPIAAGVTHRIQLEITFGSSAPIEVRVDGNTVLDETLVIPGAARQWAAYQDSGASGIYRSYFLKCIALYSLSGTYNNDWPSITDVVTLMVNSDTDDDGWTARPIQKFGAGVLHLPGAGALNCGDSSDFELGSADYTIEGWFRFKELPQSSDFATLFARWDEDNDDRSLRLRKTGEALNNGNLTFEISTDGTNGTVSAIHDVAWSPIVGRWYHIALVRASGTSYLFIDGLLQGSSQSDSNAYHTPSADMVFGRQTANTGYVSNSGFYGHVDELRVTAGVGRYTSDFAPPAAAFGRTVGEDSDFGSVVLLVGFDSSLTDESDSAHLLAADGDAERVEPGDAPDDYLTIDSRVPNDVNFIEAALVPATSILTMTGNAANNETVTIGSTTYTFKDTFSVSPTPNEVQVGADANESLANLTAAINNGPGEGTAYTMNTVKSPDVTATNAAPTTDQMTVTAITPGTAANSTSTTETLANGAWTGATLAGGANIPSPSAFNVEPPPPEVTGVRWISLRHRSRITSGSGKVRASLVVNGDENQGSEISLGTAFAYYTERFEEDPDTSAGLTPTSVVDGQFKIDRTE